MKKARARSDQLANATGGLAFFPEDANDTEAICTQIAHDIRNQYTLAYYSTNAAQRRHVPFRAGGSDSAARLGKTHRAHACRLLRARAPSAGD
jgi:hypothetical protein